MKKVDDHVPIEFCHAAKDFVLEISGDVKIYKQFCSLEKNISEEALKFAAWWELGRYLENRHSIALLNDNIEEIYRTIEMNNVLDGFNQLQLKLVLFYRLLKKNRMIDE